MNVAEPDDGELMACLRSADPARTTEPLDAVWIHDLMEDVVNSNARTSGRSRWVLTAAAVFLAAAAGAGIAAVLNGSGSAHNTAPPSSVALQLAASDPTMICMQLSADALRPADKAFEGTATEVNADKVVLAVGRWYKGGAEEVVELSKASGTSSLLEGGIEFQEGERYLISATGSTVNMCGLSAKWDQKIADTYEQAF